MLTTPMTSVRGPSSRVRVRSFHEAGARETAFILLMVRRWTFDGGSFAGSASGSERNGKGEIP